MNVRGKRIYVGLSGGVDSAVTASMLQAQGAMVTGVFIKGWYPPGLPCSWKEDRRDAMRVAARLQIPFLTLDASKEYKESVIEYLIKEYREGRTPNPDIFCNKEVKFGAFYSFAKAQGADMVATGHYAQIHDGILSRGVDDAKDQSYFLWAVPKAVLNDTVMPLGAFKKSETRHLAEGFNLPVATKKDSQGICFLGSVSMDEFLRSEIETTVGTAVDQEGTLVGTHDGAVLYTLGERVGLIKGPPGPWYVVKKDLATNTLTVSKERDVLSQTSGIAFNQANWLQEIPDHTVIAQYRYHGPRIEGRVHENVFTPLNPLPEPVAPGQSIVFYQDSQVIGGGIIS